MNPFKKKRHYPEFWETYETTFGKRLSERLEEVRFVVLDTETTGFDYDNDRILSIGALTILNNTIAVDQTFEVYLEQHFYHAANVEIHGILRDEAQERITELEALQRFLCYVGNAVIVAHHTAFDITMINRALKRHGLPKLRNKLIDTAVLYKRTLIQSPLLQQKEHYTLDELADKFDISKRDRHTALGDAYITALAFLKILGKINGKKDLTLKRLLR
ncbi:3'-5' exonuclease [Flavobacteriaceae bacterium TP-CH-4]|uniref:3'-5' exonuclease n=1 Tax=Pelagihabitans pacificus TaxID=2696054 RepID=A0A967AWP1_9FLAO|nr:3'-5' exonuclease [Pelagihabitans pacificus]NHF61568.1 3'-5' exonuclease [Pelagihabitans pacificus]